MSKFDGDGRARLGVGRAPETSTKGRPVPELTARESAGKEPSARERSGAAMGDG